MPLLLQFSFIENYESVFLLTFFFSTSLGRDGMPAPPRPPSLLSPLSCPNSLDISQFFADAVGVAVVMVVIVVVVLVMVIVVGM